MYSYSAPKMECTHSFKAMKETVPSNIHKTNVGRDYLGVILLASAVCGLFHFQHEIC